MSLKYKNNIAEVNGIFYGKFAIGSEQRQFKCQGARTRAEAKAIVDSEKFKLRQQMAGLRSTCEDVKVKELIKLYEDHSLLNKERSAGEAALINDMKMFFKEMLASKVKPSTIKDYMTWLLAERKLAPASVNRRRAAISMVFNLGIKDKKCLFNPVKEVKKLREENVRTRILLPKEEEKLNKVLNSFYKVKTREGIVKNYAPYKRIKRFIMLALLTGMRYSEILNLTWDDITPDFSLLVVLNSKSGKSREIPINKRLKRALKAMYKLHGTNVYVFTNPETGKKYNDLRKVLNSIWEKAELKDFTLHCCRHTFATRLLEKGVDIRIVQELLGHSSVKVTERYTHPNKARKYDAVNLL